MWNGKLAVKKETSLPRNWIVRQPIVNFHQLVNTICDADLGWSSFQQYYEMTPNNIRQTSHGA